MFFEQIKVNSDEFARPSATVTPHFPRRNMLNAFRTELVRVDDVSGSNESGVYEIMNAVSACAHVLALFQMTNTSLLFRHRLHVQVIEALKPE